MWTKKRLRKVGEFHYFMRIFFLRHAESEANAGDFINDDPTIPIKLTEKGKQQALVTSEKLRHISFTMAYASEFLRAQETAAIVLRHHHCKLMIEPRINERRSGMDGLSPEKFKKFISSDPVLAKPEHGESFYEQMVRVRSFLDEVATSYPDGMILAVSHENPILSALALGRKDVNLAAMESLPNCNWIELTWPQENIE